MLLSISVRVARVSFFQPSKTTKSLKLWISSSSREAQPFGQSFGTPSCLILSHRMVTSITSGKG